MLYGRYWTCQSPVLIHWGGCRCLDPLRAGPWAGLEGLEESSVICIWESVASCPLLTLWRFMSLVLASVSISSESDLDFLLSSWYFDFWRLLWGITYLGTVLPVRSSVQLLELSASYASSVSFTCCGLIGLCGLGSVGTGVTVYLAPLGSLPPTPENLANSIQNDIYFFL